MKISNFKFIKIVLVVLLFAFSANAKAETSSLALVSYTNVQLTTSHLTVKSLSSSHSKKFLKKIARKLKKLKKSFTPSSKPPRFTRNIYKNGCKPKPRVPLDGGISILVLGAAALGVRKLRSK